MFKLSGGTHFLVLCRTSGKPHTVFLTGRFDDALARWQGGARLSPVYGVNGAKAVPFANEGTCWLLFAGPLFPGDIDVSGLDTVYLSIGAYNLIVRSDSDGSRRKARELAESNAVPWEEWEIAGAKLKKIRFSPNTGGRVAAPLLTPIPGISEALTPSAREYATLAASAYGRALPYMSTLADDIAAFDAIFRETLADDELDEITRQSLLVNANAALSRHSSQAFAGTSPIAETECHYFTHSLLGIGTASLALVRIRRFVERVFSHARIIERVSLLEVAPPHSTSLMSLSSQDEHWDTEHLYTPAIEKHLPPPSGDDATIPLITCFSGRDGFRSTKLSLSAPLEVITACNTTMWTPLTLTHEISHTIVDGALGHLLPRPDDSARLARAVSLLGGNAKPANAREDLALLLCHHLCSLGVGGERSVTASDVAKAIRDGWAELNETLTHIFDFLYFHEKDAELYIDAIWASWGVIPNIQTRVRSYIIRSLSALHANHLRMKDGSKVTVEQTIECMRKTQSKHPNELLGAALVELEDKRETYRKELVSRIPLVKVVRAYLYQPQIAQALRAEDTLSGGDHAGYPHTALEFDSTRITNPLRFLSAFARDAKPSALRSAWLLFQLAYGEGE